VAAGSGNNAEWWDGSAYVSTEVTSAFKGQFKLTSPTSGGYNVAGLGWVTGSEVAVPGVFDGRTGICLKYSLEKSAAGLGCLLALGTDGSVTGSNDYRVVLDAKATSTSVYFALTSFAQEGGWGTSVSFNDIKDITTQLKFQCKGADANAEIIVESIHWSPDQATCED
jgi:hypothetical protein